MTPNFFDLYFFPFANKKPKGITLPEPGQVYRNEYTIDTSRINQDTLKNFWQSQGSYLPIIDSSKDRQIANDTQVPLKDLTNGPVHSFPGNGINSVFTHHDELAKVMPETDIWKVFEYMDETGTIPMVLLFSTGNEHYIASPRRNITPHMNAATLADLIAQRQRLQELVKSK